MLGCWGVRVLGLGAGTYCACPAAITNPSSYPNPYPTPSLTLTLGLPGASGSVRSEKLESLRTCAEGELAHTLRPAASLDASPPHEPPHEELPRYLPAS